MDKDAIKIIKIKLRQNPIELSIKEWDEVANNAELQRVFLSKVKRLIPFNYSENTFPESLIYILWNKKYMIYTLEIFRKYNPIEYAKICSIIYDSVNDKEFTKTFGKGSNIIFKVYYEARKKDIYKMVIDNPEEFEEFSDDRIEESIIKSNNIQTLKVLPTTLLRPSEELENFILANVDKINFKLPVCSNKIADSFINADKLSLILDFYKRYEIIQEKLLEEIKKEEIEYEDIPKEFISQNFDTPEVLKIIIEHDLFMDYYHRINLYNYMNDPRIENAVIKAIKNNTLRLSNLDGLHNFPRVFEACALFDDDFLPCLIRGDSNEFIILLEMNPEFMLNLIKKYYENNISRKVTILKEILEKTNNNKKTIDINFINNIFQNITVDEYIELYNYGVETSSYYFLRSLSEIYNTLSDIKIDKIPENYKFDTDYGEKIITKIIPLLNNDQLDNILLTDTISNYTNTKEKFEAFIFRTIELKNTMHNNLIKKILRDNISYRTKEIMGLVNREDNPLGLNIETIYELNSFSFNNTSINQIKNIITNSDSISTGDFTQLIKYIFEKKTNDNQGLSQEKKEIVELLFKSKGLINSKNDIFRVIEGFIYSDSRLSDSDREFLQPYIRNFLMLRDDVPLDISIRFDSELRKNSTYNTEFLQNYESVYNFTASNTLPDDYYEYIINSVSKGIEIEMIHLLLCAYKTNNIELLKYNNIILDLGSFGVIADISQSKYKDEKDISTLAIKQLIKLGNLYRINYNEFICKSILENPEYKKLFLEKIKDSTIADYDDINEFKNVFFDKDVIPLVLSKDPNLIEKYVKHLKTIIINDDQDVSFPIDVELFIHSLATTYNIPIDNIRELSKLLDYKLLAYIDDTHINDLLHKDFKIVKRFVEIYKLRPLDIKTIEAVNDSLQQNIFERKHSEIINIFTDILDLIERGITDEEVEKIISILCKKENGIYLYMKQNIDIKDSELNELYKINKEEFIRVLIKKIQVNQNEYISILNQITNNYIHEHRNEITRNEDIYKDTNLEFEYDEKGKYDAYLKYYIDKKPNELLIYLKNQGASVFDFKTLGYLINKSIGNYDKDEEIEIKKNIPKLKAIFKPFFEQINERKIDVEYLKSVKKNPKLYKRTIGKDEIYKINFEVIYKLIEDEEKYNSLIKILNKLKILDWGNTFDNIIEKLTFGEQSVEIHNFINAFNTIYDLEKGALERQRNEDIGKITNQMKEENKSEEEIKEIINEIKSSPIVPVFSAFRVLQLANQFTSHPSTYKIILGTEDYNLVNSNPNPNSAAVSNEILRLDKNIELMLKMMEIDEITIPSFVKDYKYPENEKRPLRVIVGCRADSRNLTHGERTGACMRAYGVGHELWNFAGTDARGFHITFVDPITGQYISRVSGFRNGNTVFLNQLRNSLNQTVYSDADVIEACKDIAKEIIEQSKDSDMPIENVVCSPSYALENTKTQKIAQSQGEIREGCFENGHLDVNEKAVILATTGENGIIMPFKPEPDVEKQPKYKCCRLPKKEYTNEKITDEVKIQIQRIDAIKKCLNHKDDNEFYKSIDYDYRIMDANYKYVIIGQDYYVALKTNGEIISNYIFEKEDTIKEFDEAYKTVEQYKNNNGLNKGDSTYGK